MNPKHFYRTCAILPKGTACISCKAVLNRPSINSDPVWVHPDESDFWCNNCKIEDDKNE